MNQENIAMAVKRRLRFSGHAKYETGFESEI